MDKIKWLAIWILGAFGATLFTALKISESRRKSAEVKAKIIDKTLNNFKDAAKQQIKIIEKIAQSDKTSAEAITQIKELKDCGNWDEINNILNNHTKNLLNQRDF